MAHFLQKRFTIQTNGIDDLKCIITSTNVSIGCRSYHRYIALFTIPHIKIWNSFKRDIY